MAEAQALGVLPEWDLDDLYPGREAPALTVDLEAASRQAEELRARYLGRLAELDGDALAEAIEAYERLDEILGRVMSFAGLTHASDMADPEIGRFYQSMQERVNDISTRTLFFTLELNRIDEAALKAKLASPRLARYAPWIRDTRTFRPHQLSDELEQLLHEKYVVGRAAWVRLFDETQASLRFDVDGRQLTQEQALHLLSDPKESVRRQAAMALAKTFGENARLFALITNTLVKDKEIDDRWRKYPTPPHVRHLANHVEPEVVDALHQAVRQSFPRLSHRYYRLKAKWLGKPRLEFWDRNAPLPETEDRQIGWQEARDIVLDAYGRFSPELAALGRRFFDNRWIDAPARPGKASGAFAHPTVPSVHPYLLVNYQGRTRDVMTLAHELGHGVHQLLAGGQGQLMCDTPLTLAETASVFGEQLTFRALLAAETEPARRKAMLASKVEDMINTVVRQIAFYGFELRIHEERRAKGELTAERIGEIWMEVQGESLGEGIRLAPEYASYWCYISHFVHAPFYVYAYAFGDCLVNALYSVYRDAEHGFQAKYLEMLKAGGTKRHKELLAPFGLDASDPAFWSKGLGVIEGFIDELETL